MPPAAKVKTGLGKLFNIESSIYRVTITTITAAEAT